MTYYTILCGSWKDARGVQRLGETDNRREAEKIAAQEADKRGEAVTVLCEHPTGRGLACSSFKVEPTTAGKEA